MSGISDLLSTINAEIKQRIIDEDVDDMMLLDRINKNIGTNFKNIRDNGKGVFSTAITRLLFKENTELYIGIEEYSPKLIKDNLRNIKYINYFLGVNDVEKAKVLKIISEYSAEVRLELARSMLFNMSRKDVNPIVDFDMILDVLGKDVFRLVEKHVDDYIHDLVQYFKNNTLTLKQEKRLYSLVFDGDPNVIYKFVEEMGREHPMGLPNQSIMSYELLVYVLKNKSDEINYTAPRDMRLASAINSLLSNPYDDSESKLLEVLKSLKFTVPIEVMMRFKEYILNNTNVSSEFYDFTRDRMHNNAKIEIIEEWDREYEKFADKASPLILYRIFNDLVGDVNNIAIGKQKIIDEILTNFKEHITNIGIDKELSEKINSLDLKIEYPEGVISPMEKLLKHRAMKRSGFLKPNVGSTIV